MSLSRLCGSIGLMVLIAATCLAGPEAGGDTKITRFRMGTPKDFFGPGSPNDTKAAITVWAENILGPNAVTEDSRLAMVFDSTDEMVKAYESRETVFQAEKLVRLPMSALDGTFAMLADHDRIRHGHALGGKQPQLSQTPVPGRN